MLRLEDCVEKRDEYKNHALEKMLEIPFRYTVRSWSLADHKTPGGIMNFNGIG